MNIQSSNGAPESQCYVSVAPLGLCLERLESRGLPARAKFAMGLRPEAKPWIAMLSGAVNRPVGRFLFWRLLELQALDLLPPAVRGRYRQLVLAVKTAEARNAL